MFHVFFSYSILSASLVRKVENLSSELELKMASTDIMDFLRTADKEDIGLLNELIKKLR